jgi:hypothetical protein
VPCPEVSHTVRVLSCIDRSTVAKPSIKTPKAERHLIAFSQVPRLYPPKVCDVGGGW